jgi:hypothetical protein
MQRVLMIHEVEDWMLGIDLSEYDVITFDDGLYSQYKHYKHFLQFSKPLYFFISTDIVCHKDVEQDESVVPCREAHERYRRGDITSYMTWEQIKTLQYKGCIIGGHGHTHMRFKSSVKGIQKIYWKIKGECKTMMDTFNQQGISINSFCFPYNEDVFGYRPTLKEYGVKDFFGNERIQIEHMYK